MNYRVLKRVSLENKPATGNTSHYHGSKLLPKPTSLEIVRYTDDGGYYLFYINADGFEQTDTHHDTIEKAMEQADFEFEVKPEEWEDVEK